MGEAAGVDLGAQQDGVDGHPEPQDQDDDAAEDPEGLRVAAESRRVGREAERGEQPQSGGDKRPGREPRDPAAFGHTGREVVDEGQGDRDEQQQDQPAHGLEQPTGRAVIHGAVEQAGPDDDQCADGDQEGDRPRASW